MTAIADVFLKTRADHLSSDELFSQFIVPPFFSRISIFEDRKSVRILGGRGCGKTMFVRYFSHGSAFSPKRQDIPEADLATVGLYLRPDTNFCGLMTAEWLGSVQAKLAFSHYVALNLLLDGCHAVRSINTANFAAGPLKVGDPELSRGLAQLLGCDGARLSALEEIVDSKLVELESWVRNPKQCDKPVFMAFASILPRFAQDLSAVHPRLTGLSFRAFIDEFENLTDAHREVICDAIKHPQARLTVHIAHKKQAVVDFKTSSDERVVEIHDLTTIDLEKELAYESEFELLAAELFLLRLREANTPFHCPLFRPELLHDARHLKQRMSLAYQEQVLKCVREVLYNPTAREIAAEVVKDQPLRRRLTDMLRKGLALQKLTGVEPEDLISNTQPEISIVLGALLNRSSQNGALLLEQYRQALSEPRSKSDPFHKNGGWIENNLYGCLFYLYAGLPRRSNITYAGFDRFCTLAKPNLRFFQALCHTTLVLVGDRSETVAPHHQLRIDAATQGTAAKQVSDRLFQDILQLGSYGVQLLEVTGRLGRIFEAFNRRRSQSEPEINHFSIDNSDRENLTEKAQELLREAKIWSVLYEAKDTKNKSDYDIAQVDLILNPIYAPHFNISYRKKRKVTLQATQANVLLCQSTKHYDLVLKRLVDSGDQDVPDTPTLI